MIPTSGPARDFFHEGVQKEASTEVEVSGRSAGVTVEYRRRRLGVKQTARRPLRQRGDAMMTEESLLTIYTDGASRGNPGPAAFAFTISGDGLKTIEECGVLGQMTNNQAEYTALVNALRRASQLGMRRRLAIRSDSELLVKQMRGEYRVKDA